MDAPMQAPQAKREVNAQEDGASAIQECDKLKALMLQRISLCDAHFKNQQQGEPDLTTVEKYRIAEQILDKSKATFLSRFGKYLSTEDLEYFKDSKSDYTINYYIDDIRRHLKSESRHVRNRRYQAMQEMISHGTYFTEVEMKARDPLLYDQMIGQFLTAEEAGELADKYIKKSDLRFSSVLMGFIDNKHETILRDWQKEMEDNQEEEEEDSDDDDEELEESEKNPPTDEEKLHLRQEFMHIMQERFLGGKDKGFSYRDIDTNENYDPLQIRQQDEEEKYFDGEEPETVMETEAMTFD